MYFSFYLLLIIYKYDIFDLVICMNKIIGIIAEYNPFHLGHIHQINEIKKIYPDSTIIVIISSSLES